MTLTRRQLVGAAAALLPARAAVVRRPNGMREVAAASRFTVARDDNWYQAFTGMAVTRAGHLVCSYLRTDQHLRTTTDIMVARSEDGGRTWKDHRSLGHLDVHKDEAIWVAPELNSLRDGRLVLICDRGQRKPDQNLPMLSQWQTKERGMWNYLFLSSDGGRTWTAPHKVDDVGGEPERIHELSNGWWMFTRTQSKPTTEIKYPTKPWGPNYYMSAGVISEDKGKTWNRTVTVADSPLHGDCEVGLAELEPGHLMAITRIGDANGAFGQPSRILHSHDYGKTWSKPVPAPFYGQRPIPGRLKSGKMLVTYRNHWGTNGSWAFLFDPGETFAFQPTSFIWDESRCQLKDGVMEIRTGDGRENSVEFGFYPVEDDDSNVEIEADLMVKEAQPEGCLISAGAWVRFEPGRVSLADRSADGFAIDATGWHKYKLTARGSEFSIDVDGRRKLTVPRAGIHQRHVRLGSRGYATKYAGMRAHSFWRALSVKVANRRDYSIDWKWDPRKGYPDQFRRDRMVFLERNAGFWAGDSGYSGWAQMPDGRIAVADYTRGDPPAPKPFVRAYILEEKDLA